MEVHRVKRVEEWKRRKGRGKRGLQGGSALTSVVSLGRWRGRGAVWCATKLDFCCWLIPSESTLRKR